MLLSEFLEHLDHVKNAAGGHTARCPNHEDNENSLFISETPDGKILLKCYAGCKTQDILDRLELRFSDLFPTKTTTGREQQHIAATYDYTDADGGMLYQVCRFAPRKTFVQRRPGPDGSWVWGISAGEYVRRDNGDWYKPGKAEQSGPMRSFPSIDRVLFGLPAVLAAIAANKYVFVVEGEKDCLTLQALGLTATTNAGGAAKWQRSYTAVLRDHGKIAIIPDNDAPGRQHAEIVKSNLPQAVIVSLPGVIEHGDVTDWVQTGGTKDELIQLVISAAKSPPAGAPPLAPITEEPFACLGYNQGRYYLLPEATGQVESWPPSGFRKENLLSLAPLKYWEESYPSDNGACWTAATDTLIRRCQAAGIFEPERQRGRGAWMDGSRLVLHQGDSLVIDGVKSTLHSTRGSLWGVYERAARIEIPYSAPLADASPIAELCELLPFAQRQSAALLAGWLAIAPICGVLRWRPHLWLTGKSGSGKSWTQDHIVGPILQGIALHVQSSTTEAGIRQILSNDARPILFDEAETDHVQAQATIGRVLELARQASSSDGGVIAKGSQHGTACRYQIRSVFLFSSVAVGIARRADENRIAVLEFSDPNTHGPGQFAAVQRAVADTVENPEFCRAFLARSCTHAPMIRESAQVFSDVLSARLGSRRNGDQYGALLAGYWSLTHDTAPSVAEAEQVAGMINLVDYTPGEETSDEYLCLAHILDAQILVEMPQRAAVRRSIGELVDEAGDGIGDIGHVTAEKTLVRYGIKVEKEGLIVSSNHSGLAVLLQNTPWHVNWGRFLGRITGAQRPKNPVRFGGRSGRKDRAILIPWDAVQADTPETIDETGQDVPF